MQNFLLVLIVGRTSFSFSIYFMSLLNSSVDLFCFMAREAVGMSTLLLNCDLLLSTMSPIRRLLTVPLVIFWLLPKLMLFSFSLSVSFEFLVIWNSDEIWVNEEASDFLNVVVCAEVSSFVETADVVPPPVILQFDIISVLSRSVYVLYWEYWDSGWSPSPLVFEHCLLLKPTERYLFWLIYISCLCKLRSVAPTLVPSFCLSLKANCS